MRAEKKTVYHCDFCSEYDLTPTSIEQHEEKCDLNPAVEKKCTGCGETKPLSDFPFRANDKRKRKAQCKNCQRLNNKAARQRKREQRRKANRRWRKENPQAARNLTRNWRKRNPEKYKAHMATYRERHPEKYKAHDALRGAVYRGKIVKPDICEDCGGRFEKRRIHGHHHDYSKPLDVEWLCHACHYDRHDEHETSE